MRQHQRPLRPAGMPQFATQNRTAVDGELQQKLLPKSEIGTAQQQDRSDLGERSAAGDVRQHLRTQPNKWAVPKVVELAVEIDERQ